MALRNPKVFMAGFASVYRSHTKNPATSGTMPSDARLQMASGHGTRHTERLSGPAVKFGNEGRRGGQANPLDRREYWTEESTLIGFNRNKQARSPSREQYESWNRENVNRVAERNKRIKISED